MRLSKKSSKVLFSLTLVVNLLFNFCVYDSLASKDFGGGLSKTPLFGKVFTNSGETTLYSSTLNLSENELNIIVPKTIIENIKRFGIPPVTLYSDSGLIVPYRIEILSSNIKTKVLNKRRREVIVLNLSDALTRVGFNPGETSRPRINLAELPSDEYRIRLLEAGAYDITTEPFTCEPPVLIVGKVNPVLIMGSVLVSIEDLEGNKISDSTVTVSSDGNFITEVRANKIIEEPAIIHVIGEKDLYALITLKNDSESNAEIAKNPIIINEATTLEASLAKKNKSVANDITKEKGEENKGGTTPKEVETKDISETDCNIKQFANECDLENVEILISIGTKFKNFLETQICNFTEYELIKKVILATKEETNLDIGKGYCEFFGRQKDENRPCDVYEEILKEFTQGHIKGLPCPPDFCIKFKGIKPPKCFFVNDFCEENDIETSSLSALSRICRGSKCFDPPKCISKPKKNLFCKIVGTEISEEECTNSINEQSQKYTITTSNSGVKYCVPQSDKVNEVIKECELADCHKKCEVVIQPTPLSSPVPNPTPGEPPFVYPTGTIVPHGRLQTIPSKPESKNEIEQCHLKCDAEAGRKADCSNPDSEFFSIQCCNPNIQGTVIITDPNEEPTAHLGCLGLGGDSSCDAGRINKKRINRTSVDKKPIKLDSKNCLCNDPNNFNEKGFVKKDAQNQCKDKCPQGFEKDPNKDLCLPICEEGLVRTEEGQCKKQEGGSIPQENICPTGTGPSETIKCVCKPPAKAEGSECKCPEGKLYTGEKGCIDQESSETPICAVHQSATSSIIPCKCATGAAPGITGECECPSDQTYSIKGCINICPIGIGPTKENPCICGEGAQINSKGICACPEDQIYTDKGCVSSCPPNTESSITIPCKCAPGADFDEKGVCKCANGKLYSIKGCGDTITPVLSPTPTPKLSPTPSPTAKPTSTSSPTPKPTPTPVASTCKVNEKPASSRCICASGATVNANGVCQCTKSTESYTNFGCTSTFCSSTQVSTKEDPCVCKGTATATGPTGECKCSNGSEYSPTFGGCGD